MTLFTLYIFVLDFMQLPKRPKYVLTLFALIIIVGSLAFSQYGISYNPVTNDFTIGQFYNIYLSLLGMQIVLISYALFRSKKTVSKSNEIMQQRYLLRRGFILTIIPTVALGAILPIFLTESWLVDVAPLFSIAFIVSAAYAITKYSLFDIRPLVIRTLSYTLSLASLTIVFITTIIFIGSATVLSDISKTDLIFIAILMLLFAALYQPLKTLFDKITKNIFFRDSYQAQDVINKINATLVSTNKLDLLLQKTSKIIEVELKLQYCNFYLDPNAAIEFHLIGDSTRDFASHRWLNVVDYLAKSDQKRIIAGDEANDVEINKTLTDFSVGVIIKMISGDEIVGYLIAANKKSGNAFNELDVQLLEIVANSVAIAAQNALRYEEISQFASTLQAKVDEATRELQRSNDKLQKLDEAKDEFISMASHQLRTPLTSVKGYISMLLEGDGGEINETQKRFLDQAFLSSQRMVYLIADLLNVSRLKTGKFVIETHPTYLPDVVESEINQLYETAKARELELFFNKPESFVTLNLDETKIRQVIMNFADNAIYYTPRGGRITVGLKQLKNTIEYTVTDTGIGVPKKEQHHLFTKFYRAGNARKARPDGTGLGLYMAKKVVIAQGGSIIFKTEEGKGSTFGFSFPIPKEVE